MNCAHCSAPVADEARFCHSCGSLVSDAEGQAAATASMDQSSFLHMERLLREDTKGEYIVQHMLGRGGMAVVYLATEIQLSRKVALKVLPPELTFGHGVERFKREAKTAAALDHPNIIPIYRIASSGKLFWYAMKYLEGKSLEEMLRAQGAFSLDETLDILEQVADALDYAHDHHVIHRDIKPANVMLDNRNRVVVTDFGIAKALTDGKLTATDSVIGTPYFMSPEQGMGKKVTGASDQYSVGVMAYRMLAGHVPFDGDSAIDILHKHCMFPPPSLHDDAPHLPAHVCDAVERSLAKAGGERFPTVHDFVQSMRDPGYVPKPSARPSIATVLMDSDEAAKMRAANAAISGGGGKGRTVPEQPSARRSARPAASAPSGAPVAATRKESKATPTPKPRRARTIGLAVALIAATGVGAWQLIPRATSAPAGSELTAAPPADGSTAADPSAGTGGTPPSTDANTGAPAPAVDSAPVGARNVAANEATPKSATPPPSNPVRPQVVSRPPAANTSNPGGVGRQPEPVRSEPTAAPPAATPAPVAVTLSTLQVRFSPVAIVTLDDRPLGQLSGINEQLVPGLHRIRAEKDGFLPRDTLVTLRAGDTLRFTFRLEPRP